MSKVVINVAKAGTEGDKGSFKPLVWQSVTIKKSLDEICHSLTLELPVSSGGRERTLNDTGELPPCQVFLTENLRKIDF